MLPSINTLTMEDVPVLRPIPSSISLAASRDLLMGLLRILYVYNMQLQIDSIFALLRYRSQAMGYCLDLTPLPCHAHFIVNTHHIIAMINNIRSLALGCG